jgi:hypothetical protein
MGHGPKLPTKKPGGLFLFNRLGHEMTNQQICDFYDNNPDLTLAQFAGMLGMSVEQLKTILQTPAPVQRYAYTRGQSRNYRGFK